MGFAPLPWTNTIVGLGLSPCRTNMPSMDSRVRVLLCPNRFRSSLSQGRILRPKSTEKPIPQTVPAASEPSPKYKRERASVFITQQYSDCVTTLIEIEVVKNFA